MLRDLSGDSFSEAYEQLYDTLAPPSGWKPDAAEALPALLTYLEQLDSPERAEVFEIVHTLAVRAAADEPWRAAWTAAVPRLLALAADVDADVRRAAVLVLGERPDPAVLAALLDRWPAEPVEGVRLGLVIAIGELGGADVLPWLAERTETDAIHAAALTTTARITGEAPVERLADLLSRDMTAFAGLHGYQRPAPVRWAAGRLAPGPRAELLAALATRPARRSAAAQVALGEIADRRSAVEGLLPLVGALLDTPQRGTAAALLGGIAPASAEYADQLFALADDPQARDYALWALLRLKDARCVEPLLARFRTREDALMTGSVGDRGRGHWSVFKEPGAHQMLMDAPEFAPEFLPWVGETLDRSTHRHTVWPLTRLLRVWGPAGAPAAPHLTRLLRDDDPHTVEWCADALADIGGEPVPELKKIAKGRRRPWRTRAAAATAFARLGGDRSLAVELLENGIKAGELSAVEHAAALGTIGAPLADVLRACHANEQRAEVVIAAALGQVTGEVAEALPVLLRALEGVEPMLVEWHTTDAVRALARLGPLPGAVAPVLRELLASDGRFSRSNGCDLFREDDAFRRDAARALANCAS
ncbi:HEAT repeat domain-containing protein [Amycolatopsis sp. OK19-0408]|uniref:HEAT repeat domain-containing protein n=1 Tax=Amycolatopsis iheyensis TaxID=2945988 RepID=A0A9X2NFS0_9PSEU|nr:HEAT repeat domain-containing protein [Amycolatopsis iheyensis]MCR6486498.1 HEAT repeat domain-containing protein [Amycolatopsis iheyensis]